MLGRDLGSDVVIEGLRCGPSAGCGDLSSSWHQHGDEPAGSPGRRYGAVHIDSGRFGVALMPPRMILPVRRPMLYRDLAMAEERADSLVLPSFRKPPVSEVACGLQYATSIPFELDDIISTRAHFADRYPGVEQHPPLPRMTTQAQLAGVEVVDVSGPLLPRVWFIGGSDLVQLQSDRLTYNWRKHADSDDYLRFADHVRPAMIEAHDRLVAWLHERGYSEPPIDMFEVAYVNPIPLEPGDEYASIVRSLRPSDGSATILPQPSQIQMQHGFDMPETAGFLRMDIRSVRRIADDAPMILMQLTAQGQVGGTFEDFLSRVDIAREWIVRGFADMTTEEMHSRWERQA